MRVQQQLLETLKNIDRPGTFCANGRLPTTLELSRFLNDPNTQTLRFPLAERRRQHLHHVIDGKKLDTTHVTERKGRPYTLVCTKNQASYQRALQAHHVDLDHLAKLRELVKWHEKLKSDPPQTIGEAPKSTKRRSSS